MTPPRRVLVLAALTVTMAVPAATLGQPLPGAPSNGDVEDAGAMGQASGHLAGVTGPVDEIVTPTSGAPTFTLAGSTFPVELAELPSHPPTEVKLVPSFGDGPTVSAAVAGASTGFVPSHRWEGPYQRDVLQLAVTVPGEAPEGLYDIEVPHVDDRARRAVSVYHEWPDEPEIVVVADPQVTDPRAVGDGMEDATGVNPFSPHTTTREDLESDNDLRALSDAMNDTWGIDLLGLNADLEERWRIYQEAIEQINERDPDLVLFSGDLNFGWGPNLWRVEYEEGWALLNGGPNTYGATYEGFRVPTVLAPGNHDAYTEAGEDGLEYWKAYYGPPAFETTFGNTSIVSVNTYDWSELDRFGLSYAVSAWGGQIRDAQLQWLRETLCQAHGGTPTPDEGAIAGVACPDLGDTSDSRVVTFAHHSPSWQQDLYNETTQGPIPYGEFAERTKGVPGAEQLFRGAVSFTTTDQAWSGEARLETRETLRELDVDAHFAGHTHRDRVARDVGNGSIVEVPQKHREGMDVTRLQLVHPDPPGDVAESLDQDRARDLLLGEAHAPGADGPGPIYVDTTTTASGTGQYFGWRNVTWHLSEGDMPDGAHGIPPLETGAPMNATQIQELAREPARWNASHADLGLFSVPTKR